jgi:type IV pilus assembly protein PilB
MDRKPKRIGELLIDNGLITEDQLDDALNEQKRTKEFLGSILIKMGYITDEDLTEALSEQYNIPCVSIRHEYINWDLVGKFSPELILTHKCFPLSGDEFSVTVAITNPLDVWAIRKIEEEARGYTVNHVLVSMNEMDGVIKRYKEEFQKKRM